MIRDLPERLEAIADHLDDWDHPITGREDCREAARELRRLREESDRFLRNTAEKLFASKNVQEMRSEVERLRATVAALVPVYSAAAGLASVCQADPLGFAREHRKRHARTVVQAFAEARDHLLHEIQAG